MSQHRVVFKARFWHLSWTCSCGAYGRCDSVEMPQTLAHGVGLICPMARNGDLDMDGETPVDI